MARTHLLECTQVVPRPRAEVFAFFADPHNLEAITPSFLEFRIVTPAPIALSAGTLIDYELSLFGIPFGWRTRIEACEPMRSFVDVQLRGPYAWWRHAHLFDDAPGGGTIVRDEVEYALPLGLLGGLAHALFVRRSLRRIFDHRRAEIARRFSSPAAAAAP